MEDVLYDYIAYYYFLNVRKRRETSKIDAEDTDKEDANSISGAVLNTKFRFVPVSFSEKSSFGVAEASVTQKDAIHTKICKVMIRGVTWIDQGVCVLQLEPVECSDKVRLIVCDKNGNSLINEILNSELHAERSGKSNIFLTCQPALLERAAYILLHLETTKEADELLEAIDKYRK